MEKQKDKYEIGWRCDKCNNEFIQTVDKAEYDFWMSSSKTSNPYCGKCGNLMSNLTR